MRLLENLNIDFLGKKKIGFVISGILLSIAIISLVVRGLELGIDFKGGTEIALSFEKPIEIGEVREIINGIGIGEVEVKTFGGEQGVLIKTALQQLPSEVYPNILKSIDDVFTSKLPDISKTITDSTYNSVTYAISDTLRVDEVVETLVQSGFQTTPLLAQAGNNQIIIRFGISDWIEENLIEHYTDNKLTVLKEDKVGPQIGDELKMNALLAIFLALVGMLIYLGFRFKIVFAVGAVAALFHDVIITLGLFSLLYGVIPGLNLEISVSIIASFLTLVGYSVNDTVIVFDRIRENIKIHKTAELEENMNHAINRTMSRTVITSMTTLMVVAALLFFGGEVLRGFAFTLFFGIIIGTYSSIFVATPFVLEYSKRSKKRIQF